MPQVKLGFIGFGEAAFGIVSGLREDGLAGVCAFDSFANQEPAGALIRGRAQETGARLVDSAEALAAECDIIIASVIARVAVAVAESAAPFLSAKHLYIDANAASPMVKEEVGAIIEETGAQFADASLMGPIPAFRNKVPILASGGGAPAFREAMTPYGMDITVLGDKPGQASSIKMFRSIFMKGYVALLIETLNAAHKYDAAGLVMDSIAGTMDKTGFLETARLLVPRGLIHAERRAFEMNEVLRTLEGVGVDAAMSAATQKKLAWCTAQNFREHFGGEAPGTLDEVLAAFDSLGL